MERAHKMVITLTKISKPPMWKPGARLPDDYSLVDDLDLFEWVFADGTNNFHIILYGKLIASSLMKPTFVLEVVAMELNTPSRFLGTLVSYELDFGGTYDKKTQKSDIERKVKEEIIEQQSLLP